jgi:hypothetical protein
MHIGVGLDSRLPHEFDLTAACSAGGASVAGTHVLSIAIVRW